MERVISYKRISSSHAWTVTIKKLPKVLYKRLLIGLLSLYSWYKLLIRCETTEIVTANSLKWN